MCRYPILPSLFLRYVIYTTLAICRHRNVYKISLPLVQSYTPCIYAELTDFLGIGQVQVFHDLDKLLKTLGQPRIITFLLPHAALQLTSAGKIRNLLYNCYTNIYNRRFLTYNRAPDKCDNSQVD